MKPHIKIILLLLTSFLWGCNNQNSDQPAIGKTKFVHVKEVANTEKFQTTLLEHGVDLFHSNVIAYNGEIIIASRGGKLLSLTMDGDVNWFLEREGRGPGEFRDPHDMQITDDMIGILNSEDAKVSLFTIDGQFYRDVQLRGSADQFGLVDGGIHIFYPYHNDFLFARYDIETGEEKRYGDRNLLDILPDQVLSENYMFFMHLLQTDDRYTVVGLVHYAHLLIYDREKDTASLMDLSEEMEIAASMESYREWAKKYPPGTHVTLHFLDIVKLGDYFSVLIPGPWDKNYADLYRITTDGQIYDKIYAAMEGEFLVGGLYNLTLLSDGTYFGHIRSQDRLVTADIVEVEIND